MTSEPDDPREWAAYTERLLGDEIEDPNAKPKSIGERIQDPRGESAGFQRAHAFFRFTGRSVTTLAFASIGALGVMFANKALAETFPAMPPGLSFVNSFLLFGGVFAAYVVFRRLAHG